MRRVLCALALPLLLAAAPAREMIERPGQTLNTPIKVQLDAIPQGALVTMLMRDIFKVPYVIAPDVLQDRRPVSVNLSIPRDKVPERVVGYLRHSGFTVELQGGTVYVGRKGSASAYSPIGAADVPQGSPLAGSIVGLPSVAPAMPTSRETFTAADPREPKPNEDRSSLAAGILAYVPAHRDPDYLSSVMAAILPDLRFGARADVHAEADRQTIRGRDGPDLLVMAGSDEDLAKARKLCQLLDRPRPLVAVKAVVMQISDVQARGSALSVLASLGNGKLQLGSNPSVPTAAQFVRIGTAALSAVLSAVHEDTRFKVVASPNLTALSGEVATMNSGQQVPTVGQVVVTEGGAPVQSIVYRDSGITLTVRPIVRGDLIELEVSQERSTFTRTATGVEGSPTLQKVSANAQVVLKSGESVALAGLTETSNGNTRQGIFGGLLGVRTRDSSNSELVVILTAELVASPTVEPGYFVPISGAVTKGENNDPSADAHPAPAGRA